MATRPAGSEIASPTIAETLAAFLREEEARLAPRSVATYRDVVQLLQQCLDGYAHQSLDAAERARFERWFEAEGDEHREFCELFGPDRILPNVGEFLGWFMVRKVIAGKDLLRAAGTVTKRLARWLAAQGYADVEETREAAVRGAAAARDLPRAEELAALLRDFAEGQPRGREEDEVEDHFRIVRIEPSGLEVEGLDGRRCGPIVLPAHLRRRCKVGCTIAGIVGRIGTRWRLVETWNVYPE